MRLKHQAVATVAVTLVVLGAHMGQLSGVAVAHLLADHPRRCRRVQYV